MGIAAPGCGGSRSAPTPQLSLGEVAGQHFVFPFSGRHPPRDLVRRIRHGEAAGVVLFARNFTSPRDLARLTARLRAIQQPAAVRRPLLIMIDQEGGAVRRVPGPPTRSAAQIGRLGPGPARQEGRSTGALLKRLGVNVDLAPVVDVGRPHSELRREQRTFSGDVGTVSAIGDAFAAGLVDAGVAATFKHFPGLGAARHNTDIRQTVIPLPRATLRSVDERPFAMARGTGPRLVMVSLAVYPALDSVPAALSPAVVTGELRGVARFGGVSVTDSLDSPATARYGPPEDLGMRAVRAGVDLVLFGRSYRAAARAADAVQIALRHGTLTRAQLQAGSERVLRLRGELAR